MCVCRRLARTQNYLWERWIHLVSSAGRGSERIRHRQFELALCTPWMNGYGKSTYEMMDGQIDGRTHAHIHCFIVCIYILYIYIYKDIYIYIYIYIKCIYYIYIYITCVLKIYILHIWFFIYIYIYIHKWLYVMNKVTYAFSLDLKEICTKDKGIHVCSDW